MMTTDSSVIIVLAFVATAAVFGYLAFTIVSEVHTPPKHPLLFSGSLLFLRDGRIWKIVLPVATLGSGIDFRASSVHLSFDLGDRVIADGVGGLVLYNSSVITGGFVDRFTSFKIPVKKFVDGVGESSVVVSAFAYRGPDKVFRLVVDDDDDGVLDNSYIVEFVEDRKNSLVKELNTSSEVVLEIEKGGSLSLNYLVATYAASMVYDPQIVVRASNGIYRLSLVDVIKGLTKATVFTMIVGGNSDYYLKSGETGYIIVVFPEGIEVDTVSDSIVVSVSVDGDQQTLKLIIPSKATGNGVLSSVAQVVS